MMSKLLTSGKAYELPAEPLFKSALGERWWQIPAAVRQLHMIVDRHSFSGLAKVERGSSLIARVAAALFGFPPAGVNVPLVVTKTRTQRGEIWERNFGGRVFRSYLTPSARPYHYKERFWAFTYEQELPIVDGAMYLPVKRGWFLGCIPLPKLFLPGSVSKEFEIDGQFHFDVGLMAPFTGDLIVRYSGSVTPESKTLPAD